jgi:hypothetical protein
MHLQRLRIQQAGEHVHGVVLIAKHNLTIAAVKVLRQLIELERVGPAGVLPEHPAREAALAARGLSQPLHGRLSPLHE